MCSLVLIKLDKPLCVLIKTVKQKQVFCLSVWSYYKEINCSNYIWSNCSYAALKSAPAMPSPLRGLRYIENKCNKAILESFALVGLGGNPRHMSSLLFSTYTDICNLIVTFSEVNNPTGRRGKATNLSALVLNKTLTIEGQL